MNNLLILLGLILGCLLALGLVQNLLLLAYREPLAWPLRYQTRKGVVRWTMRVMIQSIWLTLLVGFPYAIGSTPVDYFSALFPKPNWYDNISIVFISWAIFLAGFSFQWGMCWLIYEPQFHAKKRRSKLIRRFLSPIPLAFMEEAVFRGILLQQFLLAVPQKFSFICLAILLSSLIFAAVHFFRPHKNILQPFIGLTVVGIVVGIAFVATGALWLPIAIHATGIFYTEVSKLYLRYRGPQLLTGNPVFPHCGLVGITALSILAAIVVMYYGDLDAWYW